MQSRSYRCCLRLLQLFQVVEGWLPPADDENSSSSVQEVGESPRAKGGAESDASGDDDESEEEVAPLVRKTRGQRQRELEASKSLERHGDDDDELPEHTSRHEATPSKEKKKKKKEVKAPPKKKTKPAKQASPPCSPSSFDATSLAWGEAPQMAMAPDTTAVLNEVPLALMPPPFAPVSGSGASPDAVALPPKDAPAENVSEAPAAASTTKKSSVSWAH